ncbi:hypothetical protein ABPG74_020373 [Tetrahymena malaccensis]
MDLKEQMSRFQNKRKRIQQMLESKRIKTIEEQKLQGKNFNYYRPFIFVRTDLKNDDYTQTRDLSVIKRELSTKGLINIQLIAKGDQAYVLSVTKQDGCVNYNFAVKAYNKQVKDYQQEEEILKRCIKKPNEGNILHKAPERFQDDKNNLQNTQKQGKKSNRFISIYKLGCMIYIFIFGKMRVYKDIQKKEELNFDEKQIDQFTYKSQIKQLIQGLTKQKYEERMSIQDALLILKGILYTEFDLDKKFHNQISGPIQQEDKGKQLDLIYITKNQYYPKMQINLNIYHYKSNNSSNQLIENLNNNQQQNPLVCKNCQEIQNTQQKQMQPQSQKLYQNKNILAANQTYEGDKQFQQNIQPKQHTQSFIDNNQLPVFQEQIGIQYEMKDKQQNELQANSQNVSINNQQQKQNFNFQRNISPLNQIRTEKIKQENRSNNFQQQKIDQQQSSNVIQQQNNSSFHNEKMNILDQKQNNQIVNQQNNIFLKNQSRQNSLSFYESNLQNLQSQVNNTNNQMKNNVQMPITYNEHQCRMPLQQLSQNLIQLAPQQLQQNNQQVMNKISPKTNQNQQKNYSQNQAEYQQSQTYQNSQNNQNQIGCDDYIKNQNIFPKIQNNYKNTHRCLTPINSFTNNQNLNKQNYRNQSCINAPKTQQPFKEDSQFFNTNYNRYQDQGNFSFQQYQNPLPLPNIHHSNYYQNTQTNQMKQKDRNGLKIKNKQVFVENRRDLVKASIHKYQKHIRIKITRSNLDNGKKNLKNDDQKQIRDLQVIKSELSQKGLKNIHLIGKGNQAYVLSVTQQDGCINYKFAVKAYNKFTDKNNFGQKEQQIRDYQQEENILKLCIQKPNVHLISCLIVKEGNFLHKPPERFQECNNKDTSLKQGKGSDAYSLGCMMYMFIFGSTPIINDIEKKKELPFDDTEIAQFKYKSQIKQLIQGLTKQKYEERMSIYDALLILKGILYTEFNLDQLFYNQISGPIQQSDLENQIELIYISKNQYFLKMIDAQNINQIKQSNSQNQLVENVQNSQYIKQQNHFMSKSTQELDNAQQKLLLSQRQKLNDESFFYTPQKTENDKQLFEKQQQIKYMNKNSKQLFIQVEQEQKNITANLIKSIQSNTCPASKIQSDQKVQNQEITFQKKQSLIDLNQDVMKSNCDKNQQNHLTVYQSQQDKQFQQNIQTKQHQLSFKESQKLSVIEEQSQASNKTYDTLPNIDSANYQNSSINNQKQNQNILKKSFVNDLNQSQSQNQIVTQTNSYNQNQMLQEDLSKYLVNNQKISKEKQDLQIKIQEEKIIQNMSPDKKNKIHQNSCSNLKQLLNNQSFQNEKTTTFDQKLNNQIDNQQNKILLKSKQQFNSQSFHEYDKNKQKSQVSKIQNNDYNKMKMKELSEMLNQFQENNQQQMNKIPLINQNNNTFQEQNNNKIKTEINQTKSSNQINIKQQSEISNQIYHDQNLNEQKLLNQNQYLNQNKFINQIEHHQIKMTQSLKSSSIQQAHKQQLENIKQFNNQIQPTTYQNQQQNITINQNKFQSYSVFENSQGQQKNNNLNQTKYPQQQIDQSNQKYQINSHYHSPSQINLAQQQSQNQQKAIYSVPNFLQKNNNNEQYNSHKNKSIHNNSFINSNQNQIDQKILKLQDNKTSNNAPNLLQKKEDQNLINYQKQDILQQNSLKALQQQQQQNQYQQQQQFIKDPQKQQKYLQEDVFNKICKTEEDFYKYQKVFQKCTQDQQYEKQFFYPRNSFTSNQSVSKQYYQNLSYRNTQNNTPQQRQSFEKDLSVNYKSYTNYQTYNCSSQYVQNVSPNIHPIYKDQISQKQKIQELNQHTQKSNYLKTLSYREQKQLEKTDNNEKHVLSFQQKNSNTNFTNQNKK